MVFRKIIFSDVSDGSTSTLAFIVMYQGIVTSQIAHSGHITTEFIC